MLNLNILKSERFRRLSKEGFWVVFGNAVSVIGYLVGIRILTELLAPAAYGELALVLTAATLVNYAILEPLNIGIIRFYAPAQELEDLGSYLMAVKRLVLSATGISFIILLLVIVFLLISIRTEWIVIATVAFVFAIIGGYNGILSGIQNSARHRSVVAFHQGIESWVRFLVTAGLLLWIGATSTVAMVGYAIAILLVFASQSIFFRKLVHHRIPKNDNNRRWQKDIWKYSWPFFIYGVFTWVQLASDRWALEFFTTRHEVGYYAVLLQLGYYPMSMATAMAMQFLAPILFQRAGDARDVQRNSNVNQLCWRLTGLVMGFTGVIFIIAYLFHTQIFKIFVAKEYMTVSSLMPWMLLSGGVFAAGQTISLNLMSQMKTLTMLPAKIITAILGIVLNIAGAMLYGTTGIVFASVLFSLSYFIWMAILSKYIRGEL